MTALERQDGKIKTRGNRIIVQTAEEIYSKKIINERIETITHATLIGLGITTLMLLVLTSFNLIQW